MAKSKLLYQYPIDEADYSPEELQDKWYRGFGPDPQTESGEEVSDELIEM